MNILSTMIMGIIPLSMMPLFSDPETLTFVMTSSVTPQLNKASDFLVLLNPLFKFFLLSMGNFISNKQVIRLFESQKRSYYKNSIIIVFSVKFHFKNGTQLLNHIDKNYRSTKKILTPNTINAEIDGKGGKFMKLLTISKTIHLLAKIYSKEKIYPIMPGIRTF